MSSEVAHKDIRHWAQLALLAAYRAIVICCINEVRQSEPAEEAASIWIDIGYFNQALETCLQPFPVDMIDVEEQIQSSVNPDELRNLAEIYQSHAVYHCTRGWLYADDKDFSLAITAYEKSLQYFEQEYRVTEGYENAVGENETTRNLLGTSKQNAALASGHSSAARLQLEKLSQRDELDKSNSVISLGNDDEDVVEFDSNKAVSPLATPTSTKQGMFVRRHQLSIKIDDAGLSSEAPSSSPVSTPSPGRLVR